jgi:hypothetical protein
MRLRIRLILALVLVLGVAIVFLFIWLRSRTLANTLGEFSEAGVQVNLSLEQNGTASCVLAARYAPLMENFHLYSKDLPPFGVHGLGRPTRLDIIRGLVPTGELTTDATTTDFTTIGSDVDLSVYPDGPITLRLPVSVAGDGSAQVKVSYMACSALNCLPPTAKTLDINLSQCEAR